MHAEGAVPPIHQRDAWAIFDCLNHLELMSLVTTMNNEVASKYWAADVETIERTNVSTRITNGGAKMPECAGHVVELAVERDGKGGSGQTWHKNPKVIPNLWSTTSLIIGYRA
jgi:hypothetical protein